jgi:two-component system sensor histidine kinase and response regulator WspE
MTARDLGKLSMHDLFRVEAEDQTQVLTSGLLALERNPTAADQLESCMRAAHSLKGAARIVDIGAGVALAHAMEDFLVAAQDGRITLDQAQIDLLLQGVDLMMAITRTPNLTSGQPAGKTRQDIDDFVASLAGILAQPRTGSPGDVAIVPTLPDQPVPLHLAERQSEHAEQRLESVIAGAAAEHDTSERVMRVTVNNLNRLLGLAGESLVESRWLKPFGQSLLRLKRLNHETARAIDSLREVLSQQVLDERAQMAIADVQRRNLECQQFLSERLVDLDGSERQSTSLAHRLYDQALACRMRPFADGVLGLSRMARDVGRSLGKQVRLEIVGTATQVDRDILEKLDAPLGHLVRNAVDHGIENSDERGAAGKAVEGVVRLEAHHSGGALQIIVSDDGRGIDLDKLRETVVKRRLANSGTAEKLSESELLEFLFLPGFTTKNEITEISGRGVGLDVVQAMIKQVRGVVRVSSQSGTGTRFQLQLPLTLSVVRTLLVEIGMEPYAFPLTYIVRAVKVPREKIEVLQGRQHFKFDGQQIGLVSAHQILERDEPTFIGNELSVVVVGGSTTGTDWSWIDSSGGGSWSCNHSIRGLGRSRTSVRLR